MSARTGSIANVVAALVAMAGATASTDAFAQRAGKANVERGSHAQARPAARDANRNPNRNVNRDINVNQNINHSVHVDVDNHGRHDHWDDHWDHPIATAAAVTATVAVTSAVVGSIVNTVPAGCVTTIVDGIAYQQCGSTWYQPQYYGTSVRYVVVVSPY